MSLTSVLKPSELAPHDAVDEVSDPPESDSFSDEEACRTHLGSRYNVLKMVCSGLNGKVPGEATEKSILWETSIATGVHGSLLACLSGGRGVLVTMASLCGVW